MPVIGYIYTLYKPLSKQCIHILYIMYTLYNRALLGFVMALDSHLSPFLLGSPETTKYESEMVSTL